MRTMTRPEFEAYEKRVEDALSRIENSIEDADLEDFGEVAAAAREVVEMRRAHLDITERQLAVEPGQSKQVVRSPDVAEKYHERTAEAAHDALNEIRIAREALGKIAANEHSLLPAGAYRGDLDRGVDMAARLAVHWDNKHVIEAARDDQDLSARIEHLEKIRDEHDISYSAGADGKPLPEIAKAEAQLLGYYKEGLEHFKTDLAIADHESGLAIGGWGPAAEYWTEEDSDAAWARFDQLRSDLHEAEANLARAAEKPEVEIPSAKAIPESTSDSTARSSDQPAEAIHQARVREDAVARHGEKAVASGDKLLEKLAEAGREMRDAEARLGRYREGDKERENRFENLDGSKNYVLTAG